MGIRQLALAGCGVALAAATQAAQVEFTDQTAASGLSFTHYPSSSHPSRPMVGGGAVGDFDGNGWPDLYVHGGGNVPDALFMNDGDGTFTDRAAEWGLTELHMGVAATVADVDGDGDDDLYVTSMGPTAPSPSAGGHKLYVNTGDRFVNVARKAGVAATTDYADGYGAAFGDYDRDGDLDLVVGGWHADDARGSRLFRNEGGLSFVEATAQANLLQTDTHMFGGIFADINMDRWPDLLVAGDFGTTRIYLNTGSGSFVEIDPGTGEVTHGGEDNWSIGKAYNGMGTAVGDFDRDGRIDWFVTAIWPTFFNESPFWGNGLYLNQGGGRFVEISDAAGVNDGGWGWGTSALDVDNDGWLDLTMTNGWPSDDPVTGHTFDGEQSYLWRNRGDLSFEEIAIDAGIDHALQGRGLVHFDYDRDGDLDLVIFSYAEPLRLYRNELIGEAGRPADANWLQIRLESSGHCELAPGGFGAKIRLVAGRSRQFHEMTSGGTYLGSSEQIAHFGLGTATSARVWVEWLNGARTDLRAVEANQRITLAAPPCGQGPPLPVFGGR